MSRPIARVVAVDVRLAANETFAQTLPTLSRGFVHVLDGDVVVGGETLRAGEVGWFDRGASTALVGRADARGAHFVLYSNLSDQLPVVEGPMQ